MQAQLFIPSTLGSPGSSEDKCCPGMPFGTRARKLCVFGVWMLCHGDVGTSSQNYLPFLYILPPFTEMHQSPCRYSTKLPLVTNNGLLKSSSCLSRLLLGAFLYLILLDMSLSLLKRPSKGTSPFKGP